MKLIIEILMGKPTKDQLQKILSMILEGYDTGINMPDGINWIMQTEGKKTYSWLQEIIT